MPKHKYTYQQALRIWNEHHKRVDPTHVWMMPRRGTPEHSMVRKIMTGEFDKKSEAMESALKIGTARRELQELKKNRPAPVESPAMDKQYSRDELQGMNFGDILAIVRQRKYRGHSGLRKPGMIDFLLEKQGAAAKPSGGVQEKIEALKRARAAGKRLRGARAPSRSKSPVREERAEKTVRERYDDFVRGKTAAERKAATERVLYFTGKGKGAGHNLSIDEARRVVMGEIPAPKKPRAAKPRAEAMLEDVKRSETARAAKGAAMRELGAAKRTLDDLDMYGPDPFFLDTDEQIDRDELLARASIDYYGDFTDFNGRIVEPISAIDALMSREPQSYSRERKPMNLMIRLPGGNTVSAAELGRREQKMQDLRSGKIVPRPPPGPPPGVRPPAVGAPKPPSEAPPISLAEFLASRGQSQEEYFAS